MSAISTYVLRSDIFQTTNVLMALNASTREGLVRTEAALLAPSRFHDSLPPSFLSFWSHHDHLLFDFYPGTEGHQGRQRLLGHGSPVLWGLQVLPPGAGLMALMYLRSRLLFLKVYLLLTYPKLVPSWQIQSFHPLILSSFSRWLLASPLLGEVTTPGRIFCWGGIHSQEMIKMKWLRSRNPGFIVTIFLYSWTIWYSGESLRQGLLNQSVISLFVLTSWCLLNKILFK